MTSRHTLTLACLFALSACSQSHGADDDGGPPPPSDGGPGVCCPIVDFFTPCSPGRDPLPGGGWAPSLAECSRVVQGFDVDYDRRVDAHGCPYWDVSPRCCLCPPPEIDAGPPEPDCEDLDEVACLNEPGCVPTYHDACCSSCEPGIGCADCVDWEFWVCRPYADACEAAFCSTASPWGCGDDPDCSGATPTGLGSCSIAGCVPAVAAEGFMEPTEPCVMVHANSCTVACRALPPTCPDGTTAEGDGSCWTGRCIPAGICAP